MRNLKSLMFTACVALAASNASASDPITLEVVVDAPVEQVWSAYTTKDGLQSWMVPVADIDLKVGGKLRTHFNPKGVLGDPQTVVNTILSYQPMRMISTKIEQAPADLPFQQTIRKIWSVVHFTPVGPGQTRITEVTMGLGDDAESRKLRGFLEDGNRTLLMQLQKKFAAKAAPAGTR